MTKPLSERSFVGTRFGYAEPISTSILVNHVCYTLHCYLSMLYDVLSEFLDIVSILVCVKHIILLLSSGVTVLLSPNYFTPSGCPPMAVLHPSKRAVHGFTVVLRSRYLKVRLVTISSSFAPTCHTITFTGLSTFHRCLHSLVLATTRHRVDLTR
jgi:hypothetical protein